MLKSYKYRIYPSKEQEEKLANYFGAVRFVYNLGLETKISAWTSSKKNLTCFDLINQLSELKNTECPWLAEAPSQALQMSLRNLDNAYTAFFKGGGFPKFKSKRNKQSISFPQSVSVDFDKGFVKVPKLREIPCIFSRTFEGKIKTVTISKTPTGKYFVSILVDNGKELPKKKKIDESATIGIDLGIKDFAILSDGTVFENQHFFKKQMKKLRVEQRSLKRKFKKGSLEQSKNYQKQKIRVSKLHEKIVNQRKDYLHKMSSSIIKNYDTICLENLNIQDMQKNNKLSLAISELGWYKFTEILEYKAEWYGKNIIRIGRFEPSSKTCSSCGKINKELKLSDREWTCQCGITHDRDANAATNIKNFGLRASTISVKTEH